MSTHIPVAFPSDESLQQAWDLMRKNGGVHFKYFGVKNGKDILAFRKKQLREFREAGISFEEVESTNASGPSS